MACLTKRNGVYYLYWKEAGKLKGKRISKDYRTAQEYRGKFETDFDRKQFSMPLKYITWKNFTEEFLTYSKVNKASRTFMRDSITINTFNKNFILKELKEFTPQILENFKSIRLEQKMEHTTINRELGTLKNMGKMAFEWKYLAENPVSRVHWLKEKKNGKVRFLNNSEIEKLLKHSKGVWHTVIMIGLYTGMRLGEVCHLEWTDVDFDNNKIVVQAKKGWSPKDYETRFIPLDEKLKKYLLAQKNKSKNKWVIDINGSIEIKEIKHEQVVSTMVIRTMREAGIKDASFHTCRHTFASHLVMNRVDLYTVGKLLGHSSTETTEIYAHLNPEYLKETITKLDY